MARSLTGATAVFNLSIAGLYDQPQTLQGYAADDVFQTPTVANAEVLMGVDGFMSAGYVFVPKEMSVMLQADSDSNDIFDNWNAAQAQAQDIFFATGVVLLRALQQKWTLTRGVLTNFAPIPDTKKLIQPRKFTITWNEISIAPT